ncbi:DUF2155 domain-containing protein, partial [bacterium]|nr:DUF2155 domain-containing protein [bacterium]
TGGMGAGGMGAGMGMQKKEYEIVVPEEVKEKYKAVDIRFGKREGGEPTTISVPVGESVKLGDSGLTLTVKAFLPAFYMDSARISSVTAELKNPAAKVTITEGDKELFDGWLFAKMPGVHPFEHPTWSVTLATGADAEAAQASAAQAKHAALDGHEGCDHAAAAPADNAECAHADAGFDHAGESPDGCCGGAKGKEAGHA